ncbi:RNA polymerase sigma-70 factor, ECF subfamily [Pedobacter steynii]|uniref:RNA polymerase sigma-70 factor, ECF subfamily n=1 Tax=Pedobacter steynii TaxID=430522 RepID=A0A1G9NU71_9SPHI|nr:RNA polymerase sigma factor [Pedobacter steynii]NQX39192.1 RNA polymerase sigma factor [Pedobacter steynii]SDL89853.1 RNA polymerase sigma-70 factor, ECF subfamily [Pedobacter steynii]
MKFLEAEELQALLLQLRQGHEPAFNALYLAYSKMLYQKINRVVKDEFVADELLQDLFLKVWKMRADIRPEQSFVSFLHTVAKNLVYDYFRKISKDKRLHERLLLNAVDYYMQTEEALIGKETSDIIQQAISRLSESRRKVFILCKMEGKSYQEAADILGITVATVNSHMVTSIRSIKEYLHKNQEIGTIIITLALFRS